MRHIADVTERISAHWKNFGFIRLIEDVIVPGFLHAFPAKVNRVPATLIIRFDKERLRFAFLGSVVLSPDKAIRPIAIAAERQVVNRGGSRAMDFGFGMELFGTLDVTVRN